MLKSFFLPISTFVILCTVYVYITFILPPRLSKVENDAIAYGSDGIIGLTYRFRRESIDKLEDIKCIATNKTLKIQLLAKQADKIHHRTSELISMLSNKEENIINETGGRSEIGEIVGWKTSIYFPTQSNYYKEIDDYCKFISGITGQKAEIETVATLSPLLIFRYSLNILQVQIGYLELIALNHILYQISADNLDFQHYKPLIITEENPVKHNTVYKSYLSLVKTNPNLAIQLTCNEGEIKIENGIAKIRFIAQADKFDAQGYAKKQLNGRLTLNYAGKDTTFRFSQSYTIEKKNRFK